MSNYTLIALSTLLVLAYPFAFSITVSVIFGTITAWTILGKTRVTRSIGFCAMFSTYGLALGFFAGASKEPIVGTIISSVVTFLSGYFAYMMSKEMHPRTKAVIPSAVICFILSLLFGATYMVKLNQAM